MNRVREWIEQAIDDAVSFMLPVGAVFVVFGRKIISAIAAGIAAWLTTNRALVAILVAVAVLFH
jgi:hypothetical protein